MAVGPGRRSEDTGDLIPIDVKVGDTVVYSKYGGTENMVESEDLLSFRDATSWPSWPVQPAPRPRRSARRPGSSGSRGGLHHVS